MKLQVVAILVGAALAATACGGSSSAPKLVDQAVQAPAQSDVAEQGHQVSLRQANAKAVQDAIDAKVAADAKAAKDAADARAAADAKAAQDAADAKAAAAVKVTPKATPKAVTPKATTETPCYSYHQCTPDSRITQSELGPPGPDGVQRTSPNLKRQGIGCAICKDGTCSVC